MSKLRNPVARSPLLRKGGPHERSASSMRAEYRRTVEAGIDAFHGLGSDEIERGERRKRMNALAPTLPRGSR
ncbi:hypothetical protein [Thiocystis violacea]|uniref:hypothetical protein n=1 Tax=Thiocystis violacea TaxID=13725 RepID=UPI0019082A00|nr:hypothetical protein [Thiocystis violacea]